TASGLAVAYRPKQNGRRRPEALTAGYIHGGMILSPAIEVTSASKILRSGKDPRHWPERTNMIMERVLTEPMRWQAMSGSGSRISTMRTITRTVHPRTQLVPPVEKGA